jgi:hypothetical protein
VKVNREYEASDIDIKDNKVHSFLYGGVMVAMIRMLTIPRNDSPDAMDTFLKSIVAETLTEAEKQGIVIAIGESVPEVFR